MLGAHLPRPYDSEGVKKRERDRGRGGMMQEKERERAGNAGKSIHFVCENSFFLPLRSFASLKALLDLGNFQ